VRQRHGQAGAGQRRAHQCFSHGIPL